MLYLLLLQLLTISETGTALYMLLHLTYVRHLILLQNTCLTALCPGLPGWAGTRKVKPTWILLKQETASGSWAICKSAPRPRQITTPAPNHSKFFYRQPCYPTNSVKALKATHLILLIIINYLNPWEKHVSARWREPCQIASVCIEEIGKATLCLHMCSLLLWIFLFLDCSGCCVDGQLVGCILYADDILLLSASASGLWNMLLLFW